MGIFWGLFGDIVGDVLGIFLVIFWGYVGTLVGVCWSWFSLPTAMSGARNKSSMQIAPPKPRRRGSFINPSAWITKNVKIKLDGAGFVCLAAGCWRVFISPAFRLRFDSGVHQHGRSPVKFPYIELLWAHPRKSNPILVFLLHIGRYRCPVNPSMPVGSQQKVTVNTIVWIPGF